MREAGWKKREVDEVVREERREGGRERMRNVMKEEEKKMCRGKEKSWRRRRDRQKCMFSSPYPNALLGSILTAVFSAHSNPPIKCWYFCL